MVCVFSFTGIDIKPILICGESGGWQTRTDTGKRELFVSYSSGPKPVK